VAKVTKRFLEIWYAGGRRMGDERIAMKFETVGAQLR
jgi:hypothetical protein